MDICENHRQFRQECRMWLDFEHRRRAYLHGGVLVGSRPHRCLGVGHVSNNDPCRHHMAEETLPAPTREEDQVVKQEHNKLFLWSLKVRVCFRSGLVRWKEPDMWPGQLFSWRFGSLDCIYLQLNGVRLRSKYMRTQESLIKGGATKAYEV